jgi:hypothetical protein
MLISASLLAALRVNLLPFFFVSHGHVKERLSIHVVVEGRGCRILFWDGQKQLICTTRRRTLWRLRLRPCTAQTKPKGTHRGVLQ